jgi:CheY-like chemotaxis protein
LDFSRIESGRQKASFVLEDLVQFTKQLASNFQSIIEKAGLQFTVKAESFIQPVYIDKEMWEKIVFNLLSNAFKFTISGGITVSLFAREKYAVLKITDTGVGIPKEELPNLFQRFHRINSVQSRTHEGTGIGLSMIKELVKQLGGEISVESEINKGTSFEVHVPFGKMHIPHDQFGENKTEEEYLITNSFIEEAKGLLGEEINEKNSNSGTSGDLILVVDDNADMRQHLKSLLAKTYRIETAANGMEALHKVKEKIPSLILSDIMMPILNGADLLREIKSNPVTKNIPVILLTARAGEESKIEGFEMGADDYLVKPFSSIELLSRIRTQLRVSSLKKTAEHNMYNVFNQAPVAIAVFKGKDLICEFANDPYLEIVKKQKSSFIGKPLFDALPETKTVLHPIAMQLLETGEPFPAQEFEIVINRNGKDETCYFNSIWTPLRAEDNSITGIIVCAHEVTQMVINRN